MAAALVLQTRHREPFEALPLRLAPFFGRELDDLMRTSDGLNQLVGVLLPTRPAAKTPMAESQKQRQCGEEEAEHEDAGGIFGMLPPDNGVRRNADAAPEALLPRVPGTFCKNTPTV